MPYSQSDKIRLAVPEAAPNLICPAGFKCSRQLKVKMKHLKEIFRNLYVLSRLRQHFPPCLSDFVSWTEAQWEQEDRRSLILFQSKQKPHSVCVSLSLSSSSVKLDRVPVSQPVTTKCQPIQTVCSRLLQRWEHTVPSWHHFDSRDVVWHTSALMKIVMTRKPQIMKHLVITLCYINAHDDTQFPWKTIYTGIIWYIMHQHVPSFLPMTVPLTCDIKYSKCLESFQTHFLNSAWNIWHLWKPLDLH